MTLETECHPAAEHGIGSMNVQPPPSASERGGAMVWKIVA